jgi:hypothetical protein
VLDAATGVADHTGAYFGVNMGHGSCANLKITLTTVVSGSATETITTTAAEVTTPFSTSLSLRITAPPSNIPVDKKNGGVVVKGGLGVGGVAGVVVGMVGMVVGALVAL